MVGSVATQAEDVYDVQPYELPAQAPQADWTAMEQEEEPQLVSVREMQVDVPEAAALVPRAVCGRPRRRRVQSHREGG